MPDEKLQLLAELESMVPALIRRVFVMDSETPLTELPLAQMRLLRLLQEHPGLRVSQAAAELGTTPSAVTQMCHRLSGAGYLDRADDLGDGRGKRLTLSTKGMTLLVDRKQQRLISGMNALKDVSKDDIRAAVVALKKLIDAAPRPSEAEPMELIEAVEPHPKLA